MRNNNGIDIGMLIAGMAIANRGLSPNSAAIMEIAFIDPIPEPRIQTFATVFWTPIICHKIMYTSAGANINL